MFTLGKGKASVFTNGVETYNKETLGDEIRKLTTTNIQLMTDKIKTEKVRVNLEADKIQLFDEKNSLVAKKKTSNRDYYVKCRRAFQRFNTRILGPTFRTNIK